VFRRCWAYFTLVAPVYSGTLIRVLRTVKELTRVFFVFQVASFGNSPHRQYR